MYLYKLTNTVNGKAYIGITIRPVTTRLAEHLGVAKRGKTTLIARAIRKYGAEAFALAVLEEAASFEELCAMECAAIAAHGTFKPGGYNLTLGGEGTIGYLHTEETKQRISALNTGKVHDQDFRDKVSQRFRGVPKSPEQREKMGEWQRGENNSQYGKTPAHHAKMLAAAAASIARNGHPRKGATMSPEHKAKLIAANRGRKMSPEHAAKMSAIHRGKVVSEETRAKLREATLRQLATQGNPMQGRQHSEATRALISARHTGRPLTEEHKAKLRGRVITPEHRQAISAALTGQEAWNKGIPWEVMTKGKKHPLRRPVEVAGIVYESVMACHRETGFSRNYIKDMIKRGEARYVPREET